MVFERFGKPEKTAPDGPDLTNSLRAYIARHAPGNDIEDILQETVLRLHQRASNQDIENITAYAFQAAHSVIVDQARRNAARKSRAHVELNEAHHPVETITPERVLAGKQSLNRFVVALEEMPERTRQVFLLHRFEDMNYAEIASHLAVSHSAVGKHIVKALRFLTERGLP